MKKLFNFLLMAGIIASMACSNPSVSLIASAQFEDFPSGSSMEIFNNNIILIGDDATKVIILDLSYQVKNTIIIDSSTVKRIAKDIKPDYEASTIIEVNGVSTLIAFGSGSTNKRKNVLLIPLPVSAQRSFTIVDTTELYEKILETGLKNINIEGAASINQQFVLSNRANQQQPFNSFIIFNKNTFDNPSSGSIKICKIILPSGKLIVGVSGLCYVPSKDLLLFTASTEETVNTYDDGEIGDSFIGIISNASTAVNADEVEVKTLINLSDKIAEFKKQKIEGIAVESVTGNNLIIHLVADNDNGSSRLFKLTLQVK